VARCRGWMERQSSLLDEFFLFSRRSFKNGRLACKSARDLASWIYFDYFFSTLLHEAICVTLLVPVRVARVRLFGGVCWNSPSIARVFGTSRPFRRPFREVDTEKPVFLSLPGYLIGGRPTRAASCCPLHGNKYVFEEHVSRL